MWNNMVSYRIPVYREKDFKEKQKNQHGAVGKRFLKYITADTISYSVK